MADDNANQKPAGSSILTELDRQTLKDAAAGARAHIQAPVVQIDDERSGQLAPSHSPTRGR